MGDDLPAWIRARTEVIRDLSSDQLAIASLDGYVVEGELDPDNADIAAMHSVVYRARRDVGSP